MLRRESSRLVPATWLDGAVAGLGAAALCAAFAFHSIANATGGGPAAVATNLAYPIGDVLLLAMVVGGSAVLSGRRGRAWLFLAAGCALNAVGDTFNLFGSSGTHVGIVVDGVAWPTAIWLMSMAVWLRPGRPDVLGYRPAPGFLLPGPRRSIWAGRAPARERAFGRSRGRRAGGGDSRGGRASGSGSRFAACAR